MKQETYTIWTFCKNCGEKQQVETLKGRLFDSSNHICSNCGCGGTLEKSWSSRQRIAFE